MVIWFLLKVTKIEYYTLLISKKLFLVVDEPKIQNTHTLIKINILK